MTGAVLTPTTVVSDHVWTVDDLELMPRGYRYEILEGVLYMAAMPGWPHGAIAQNLADILSPWVRTHQLGRVLGAQNRVYYGGRNYVDPDLIYLRPDQLPKRVGARPTTAALAVEILSPSNLRAPREGRERLFHRAGVEELWYVDYDARSLEVRRRTADGYETVGVFRDGETVSSAVLPGLSFPLEALWDDLGE